MQRVLRGLARFALSAWVGAAVLFVVSGISEVRSAELDSFTRDVLVTLRFPAFYVFGFSLVGLAGMSLFLSALLCVQKRRTRFLQAGVVLVILLLMAGDYHWIFHPLVEMITPPGQSRPSEFINYHKASKWINLCSIALCALMAGWLCGEETVCELNR